MMMMLMIRSETEKARVNERACKSASKGKARRTNNSSSHNNNKNTAVKASKTLFSLARARILLVLLDEFFSRSLSLPLSYVHITLVTQTDLHQ